MDSIPFLTGLFSGGILFRRDFFLRYSFLMEFLSDGVRFLKESLDSNFDGIVSS